MSRTQNCLQIVTIHVSPFFNAKKQRRRKGKCSNSKRIYSSALELAQAIKKGCCDDSCEGNLKEYNDYHATHREIPPNVELLEKIQQKIQ